MSLRHALLGLLEDGPASGYTLANKFDRSLRRWAWSAQQSHIYPELKRMADDGLITVAEEGARGRRSYALTKAGLAELQAWLRSEPKERATRDERMLRMLLISALDDDAARELIDQHLDEALSVLDELTELAEAADADDSHPRGRLRMGRLALELAIYRYRAQRDWARWALAQLPAR